MLFIVWLIQLSRFSCSTSFIVVYKCKFQEKLLGLPLEGSIVAYIAWKSASSLEISTPIALQAFRDALNSHDPWARPEKKRAIRLPSLPRLHNMIMVRRLTQPSFNLFFSGGNFDPWWSWAVSISPVRVRNRQRSRAIMVSQATYTTQLCLLLGLAAASQHTKTGKVWLVEWGRAACWDRGREIPRPRRAEGSNQQRSVCVVGGVGRNISSCVVLMRAKEWKEHKEKQDMKREKR